MTLPSSGSISASQIRDEFQRSNPVSLNQYYGIVPGIPSSGAISYSDFYGKSYIVDDVSMSVGIRGIPGSSTRYGYLKSGEGNAYPTGSISPDEINAVYPSTSHIITAIFWDNYTGSHLGPLGFTIRRVLGASITNSGWSALVFNNKTFTRSSAIYSTSGNYTYWIWADIPNPFEGLSAGSVIPVQWLGE